MRFLGSLAFVSVVASMALGNGAPPPLPKGMAYVIPKRTVKLEKELKGYVLFTHGFSDKELPKKFEVGTEKFVELPFHAKGMALYAVPNDLVPTLKAAEQWEVALKDPKAGIQSKVWITVLQTVDEKDEQKKIEWAFVIKSVDEKGIAVEDIENEKKEDKKEEKKPLALTEPGHLIGGIAAALSFTLGGLWLMRRKKLG